MSNPTPPPEAVPFETMLDQLSQQLEFKSRERLSLFVRSAVEKALETLHKPSYKNKAPEQMKYRVSSSSRCKVHAELDVLVENGKNLKELCSIGLRQDVFRGIPDGSPKLTNPKNLPPLVRRQRVRIIDIMQKNEANGIKLNYLKRRAKQRENSGLTIDIQAE